MERRHKLLVVEDEHILRVLVADFLRRAGYRVDEAKDGPAALHEFEAGQPYDLVMLDLNLPGLSGFEVFNTLRSRQPQQAILVASAAITLEYQEALGPLGRVAFLTKPYHPEHLLVQVREMISEAHFPSFPEPALVS